MTINTASFYRWDGEDLILDCHLQPKASKDEFTGLQAERLRSIGCAYGQGFLWGRGVPIKEFAEFLRSAQQGERPDAQFVAERLLHHTRALSKTL